MRDHTTTFTHDTPDTPADSQCGDQGDSQTPNKEPPFDIVHERRRLGKCESHTIMGVPRLGDLICSPSVSCACPCAIDHKHIGARVGRDFVDPVHGLRVHRILHNFSERTLCSAENLGQHRVRARCPVFTDEAPRNDVRVDGQWFVESFFERVDSVVTFQ